MYDMDDLMPFGKYKGTEIEEIIEDDPQYMVWAVENMSIQFSEEVLEIVGRI